MSSPHRGYALWYHLTTERYDLSLPHRKLSGYGGAAIPTGAAARTSSARYAEMCRQSIRRSCILADINYMPVLHQIPHFARTFEMLYARGEDAVRAEILDSLGSLPEPVLPVEGRSPAADWSLYGSDHPIKSRKNAQS